VYTEEMPWMQTSATEQRLRFAEDFESGQWSMTELCERYGVTRPTGYKWVGRFREAGSPGMTERSRAPHVCPHRTPAKIEALIVTDPFSRTLLACRGLSSVKTEEAKPVFRALFREVGLPEAIRTDNGTPFASTGIHGLCGLNVWWMQLGIVHQRIHPASPQEN